MKKRIFLPIFCVLLVGLSLLPCFAGERAYNWYFMRTPDHSTPPCPPEFPFLAEYNAYFLDRHADPNDKVLYLTFDAGYENGNIAKILDTLSARGATGAFFILENLIRREPALVKRMAAEGHTVCNHTAKHKDMTRMGEQAFTAELTVLADAYKELTGTEIAPFYRPPEGRFNESNLQWANNMGYKTIFWSFAYADWDNDKQPDHAKALKKLTDHLHNGEILLLHPTSSTNAAILGDFLDYAKKEGYRFGSLSELVAKQAPSDLMRSLYHSACLPHTQNHEE